MWLAEPVPCYVWDMRIDPDIRKCVAFVGVEAGGRFLPTGTGFFCSFKYSDDVSFHFLVTAAHVLDQIKADTFSIRLNRRDGSAATETLDRRRAIKHTVLANDVALVPVSLDVTVYDVLVYELSREKLAKRRQTFQDVGLGDEVCAIGLYTSHHGLTKNIPVVRIGNLAAMPEEPLRTPKGYAAAYLVELRTIAGLSGSPVF